MTIDGKKIAADLESMLSERIKKLPFRPVLCDVLVGNDPASLSFVNTKQKAAERIGIQFKLAKLPQNADENDIKQEIMRIQADPHLCGLLVQLPLPDVLDTRAVLSAIDVKVDVDILSPISTGVFYDNGASLIPPTAGAILHILDTLGVDLSLERFLVIGQGDLVGRPITFLLQQRGYTVATADVNTENTADLLRQSTAVISGVGKAGFLTAAMLPANAIIIDAGTSESGGTIAGDVDFANVAPTARFISPVPGGVGPVTVAKLLENVVIVAESRV